MKRMIFYPVLISVLLVTLSSCSRYGLINNTMIIRTNQLTRVTTAVQTRCELSILSMREAKAGDVRISDKCDVTGSAESLGANEELINLLSTVIKKVP